MADQRFRIDLGVVDLSSLHSEADLRREAARLLPMMLTQIGEASAEHAWTQLQKSFRSIPGFKGNNSSGDKRKFIRDSGEKYRKDANYETKQKILHNIVAQLKERRPIDERTPMPITFNEKESLALRFLKQEYLNNQPRP